MNQRTKQYLIRSGVTVLVLLCAIFLGDQKLLESFVRAEMPVSITEQLSQVYESIDGQSYATVVRVIDGDTLVIQGVDQKDVRVRLLGIDTPESVHPTKPVECFGKEASQFLKEMVEGKRVRLLSDVSQDATDRYGRVLAYVFLEDGTHVNEQLLQQGYAYEYMYRDAYTYRDVFVEAERDAKDVGRGLWAPGMCVEK
jgi:micrococcal nuclease